VAPAPSGPDRGNPEDREADTQIGHGSPSGVPRSPAHPAQGPPSGWHGRNHDLAAQQPTPAGNLAALWPLVREAITLELVALIASPTNQHPTVTDAPPAEWTAHVPDDAQPADGHGPAETASGDRAQQTREAEHDTDTHNTHPTGDVPAETAAETRHAPAARPAGTNGHLPGSGHGRRGVLCTAGQDAAAQ
jgi:hypothetical protein